MVKAIEKNEEIMPLIEDQYHLNTFGVNFRIADSVKFERLVSKNTGNPFAKVTATLKETERDPKTRETIMNAKGYPITTYISATFMIWWPRGENPEAEFESLVNTYKIYDGFRNITIAFSDITDKSYTSKDGKYRVAFEMKQLDVLSIQPLVPKMLEGLQLASADPESEGEEQDQEWIEEGDEEPF